MSETSRSTLTRILAFAAVVEFGTGLVLMFDPAIVVRLLLGGDVAGTGIVLGRCFGIALLALGLACWPAPLPGERNEPAVRGMLIYNVLVAAFLAYLGTSARMGGTLLWPAVLLHAGVAAALALTWRKSPRAALDNNS